MPNDLQAHLKPFEGKAVIVICNDGTIVEGIMTVVGTDYIGFDEAFIQNISNKATNSQYSHWHIPFNCIQGIGVRDPH